MKISEPADDLRRLFKEMVGGRAKGEPLNRRGQGLSVRPILRAVLSRPELEHRVKENVEVTPRHIRAFRADYAFCNGKDSFIIPQTIHVDQDQTRREAELLAFRGLQLAKHGLRDREAELIVPLPDPSDRFREATKDVAELLRDNQVRTVFGSDLNEFADEIRAHAHVL
jgi:hypothetical protein